MKERLDKIRDALLAPPAAVPCPNLTPMGECIKARMAAQQSYVAGTEAPPAAVPAEPDAEALDFARNAARLLHGFMLDTNAIGPQEAGVNLARSIKAMLAAADKGSE